MFVSRVCQVNCYFFWLPLFNTGSQKKYWYTQLYLAFSCCLSFSTSFFPFLCVCVLCSCVWCVVPDPLSFINNLSKVTLSFKPSMVIVGSLYSLQISFIYLFLYHVNQCRVQIKLLLLLSYGSSHRNSLFFQNSLLKREFILLCLLVRF